MTMAYGIYHIWAERNARSFKTQAKQVEFVVRQVIQEVHSRNTTKSRLASYMSILNLYPWSTTDTSVIEFDGCKFGVEGPSYMFYRVVH